MGESYRRQRGTIVRGCHPTPDPRTQCNATKLNRVFLEKHVHFRLQIKLDDANCWLTNSGEVYTCQGMVAKHMQGNMVKLCGCAVGFAIVQLALAIAGCVVRFPRLYSYCACCCKKKQKGKSNKVASAEETPVTVL